ncbi:MAG: STAS/SEC14 domain-containing protein [Solirubrobacteraceae bacterium]
MLTVISDLPSNVVGVEADGKVTSEDYEKLLVPAVDAARSASPEGKVRVLYVLHDDFPDYTAGAIWEDTKLGLGRFRAWERIAVVCDAEWLRKSLRAFAWMLPGEVKTFDLDDLDDAREWITAGD